MPATNHALELRDEQDILLARRTGRDLARELGFTVADQTRLATAISEITRNALRYAGSGTCRISYGSEHGLDQITVEVVDGGPGIPDLQAALVDGWSTGGGLGMGLSGTRRLMGNLEVNSRPGRTQVTFRMARRSLSRWPAVGPICAGEAGLDAPLCGSAGAIELRTVVRCAVDVFRARHCVAIVCRATGFAERATSEVLTSTTELANNLVLHAIAGGVIECRQIVATDWASGVELVAIDEAPGIADISMVMTDGFTTCGGMGSGLPSVRRLMDGFEIFSTVGAGTTVRATKWLAAGGKISGLPPRGSRPGRP